jgi:transcriptional regulator GlxA family with amidase domain
MNKVIHIAIAQPQKYQRSIVYGFEEILQIAMHFNKLKKKPNTKEFVFSYWSEFKSKKTIRCIKNKFDKPTLGGSDYVLVPPSLDTILQKKDAENWCQWLVEKFKSGSYICSVCTGSFLLAEAGLLNGKRATTHWMQELTFKRLYPKVKLDTDKVLVKNPQITTAGGMTSYIDLALWIVGREFGKEVLLSTAKFMLVDPGERLQATYKELDKLSVIEDAEIYQLQKWMRKNLKEEISIAKLANKVGLGSRTLLRRFKKVTGTTPIQYLQQQRVAEATRLLEDTKKNVDQISWEVGYEDVTAFRRVFIKIKGISPGEYRKKFKY